MNPPSLVTSLLFLPTHIRLLFGLDVHLDWNGCWCFLLQLLARFFLSCFSLSLLLKFPLLTCDGALSHKVNLTSCCHPLWLPFPCPVLLVLLFVGPGVKDPPGDLHLRLCAHLDAITRDYR